jgi:hypothetical protein
MKGCLAFLGVVVIVMVAAAVAVFIAFTRPLHEAEQKLSVPHVSGSALRVETANGGVSVRRGDPGSTGVEITAKIRAASEERLAAFAVQADRGADGALVIGPGWPEGKQKSRESCRFEITVPDGVVGVTIKSSNGAIEIGGLAGEAALSTSNGTITVDSHAGRLTASTSNGRIEATGIDGAVTARSSNGTVEVTLSPTSAGPVEIATSNGSVELGLGPAFTGTLTLKTSNGRIDTSAATGAQVTESGRHHTQLTFGDNPASASSISTSNGSVTVRRTAPAAAPADPQAGSTDVERED